MPLRPSDLIHHYGNLLLEPDGADLAEVEIVDDRVGVAVARFPGDLLEPAVRIQEPLHGFWRLVPSGVSPALCDLDNVVRGPAVPAAALSERP
jgi:hypothetical protein